MIDHCRKESTKQVLTLESVEDFSGIRQMGKEIQSTSPKDVVVKIYKLELQGQIETKSVLVVAMPGERNAAT